MKRFIGGLLVLSVLTSSTASLGARRLYNYNFIPELVFTIKKQDDEEEIINLEALIRKALNDIDINKRTINQLLKEKAKLVEKLSSRMDFLAFYKKPLTDSQMKQFSDYSGSYRRENGRLINAIDSLENCEDLNIAKKELYSLQSDKSVIYEKLRSFIERQLEAVKYLKNVIFMTNQTLAVI